MKKQFIIIIMFIIVLVTKVNVSNTQASENEKVPEPMNIVNSQL
ncbi:hypothetical protein ACQKND_22500 [Viridibacillus arvi]